MTDKLLVLSNCGSAEEAERIARRLVDLRLAACVNISAPVRSVYRWKGKVEDAQEWGLAIKTTVALFPKLRDELRRLHSYETPEIIALPVYDGLDDYLRWIDDQTATIQ